MKGIFISHAWTREDQVTLRSRPGEEKVQLQRQEKKVEEMIQAERSIRVAPDRKDLLEAVKDLNKDKHSCKREFNYVLDSGTIDLNYNRINQENFQVNKVLISHNLDLMRCRVVSQSPPPQQVRWNRGKIMLVGQGRAGKTALANNLTGTWIPSTPSTRGAEQFDVKLIYGGVNGGKLQQCILPESQLESFLAEPYSHEPFPSNPSNSHPDSEVISNTASLENRKQLHEFFKLNPRDISQEQIQHYKELQEMEIPSKYKLTLIDFGGQSVFNVLHAFFMSKYSIYLVVFDMELFLSSNRDICLKEMNFWLSTIALHAFDSETGLAAPVAIVGTRGDVIAREQYEIISDEIKHRFQHQLIWKNLLRYEDKDEKLCFFPNNNKLTEDNTVREQLLRNIELKFDESEFMKKEIPLVWIKILDKMKASNHSYLSYSKLIEIASETLSDQNDDINRLLPFLNSMLRFLNKLGMILWVEEDLLRDIIILDPINYFVKPATIIICKHVPTKDEPYEIKTMHKIPGVHEESEDNYKSDWDTMLRYGLVSDILAEDLLTRYYKKAKIIDVENQFTKILLLMEKYGLAVRIKAHRLIPALLPCTPNDIDQKNSSLRDLYQFLQTRYNRLLISFPVGMHFSLFFQLTREGASRCNVLSPVSCKQQGFLPHGLFERLICRCIHRVTPDSSKRNGGKGSSNEFEEELEMNEFGFREKAQFHYKYHRVRLINKLEENRIEVLIESKFREGNQQEEKLKLREIYKIIIEETDLLLLECYERLIVKTYIHRPNTVDFTLTKTSTGGLLCLDKLVELFQLREADAETFEYRFTSKDGVEIPLMPQEAKTCRYWSIWKEEEVHSKPVYGASEPYHLSDGKITHVFLSHDWGNHQAVKQVGEALKKRGLKVWIDDGVDELGNSRIQAQLIHDIAEAIEQTECMLAFITKNYIKKVNGKDLSDYCRREFLCGFNLLQTRVIPIIMDPDLWDVLKEKKTLGGAIGANLQEFLFFDMSTIDDRGKENVDRLFKRILNTIGLGSSTVERKNQR